MLIRVKIIGEDMIVNMEELTKRKPYTKGVTKLEDFIEDQHKRRLVMGQYSRSLQFTENVKGKDGTVKQVHFIRHKLPELRKCVLDGCPNWFNHTGIACCPEHFAEYKKQKGLK